MSRYADEFYEDLYNEAWQYQMKGGEIPEEVMERLEEYGIDHLFKDEELMPEPEMEDCLDNNSKRKFKKKR